MKSYIELLRDPRWQRKRLEVMQRDGWSCVRCGDGHNELHVHHLKYIRGAAPWEYEGHDLETRCHICHRNFHHLEKAPGIAVTWSYVLEDQKGPETAVAWTGKIIKRPSNVDDEIECVMQSGEITSIPFSTAVLFIKPDGLTPAEFEKWVDDCITKVVFMDGGASQ